MAPHPRHLPLSGGGSSEMTRVGRVLVIPIEVWVVKEGGRRLNLTIKFLW